MFLFFLFNSLCYASIFILITDDNKINSLTLFNSNSTSIIPYTTLSDCSHIFAPCLRYSDHIYFATLNDLFKIDLQTGNTLQKIELFVTNLVLNEKGHVFGMTVQHGELLFSQIVNNTAITKYIFPQDLSILNQINYFPKFQSFIISYLSIKNTNIISVMYQWNITQSFSFPYVISAPRNHT